MEKARELLARISEDTVITVVAYCVGVAFVCLFVWAWGGPVRLLCDVTYAISWVLQQVADAFYWISFSLMETL